MKFMRNFLLVFLIFIFGSIFSLSLRNEQIPISPSSELPQTKFLIQSSELPANTTTMEKYAKMIADFFKETYQKIRPFYRENKESLWIIALSTIFLIITSFSLFNLSKRKKLERDLKKEYDKINSRIREGTYKLKLTEEHLRKDIEQLQDTEKYLKQIQQAIETMKLGVSITDVYGKILYVNPAQAEMHGYDPDELLGKNSSIFTTNVVREEIDINKIKEWQGQIRKSSNIRKDKVIFPVQLISDLVRNEEGKIIAIVTTCEDITKRSYDEDALKSSLSRLLLKYGKFKTAH